MSEQRTDSRTVRQVLDEADCCEHGEPRGERYCALCRWKQAQQDRRNRLRVVR